MNTVGGYKDEREIPDNGQSMVTDGQSSNTEGVTGQTWTTVGHSMLKRMKAKDVRRRLEGINKRLSSLLN